MNMLNALICIRLCLHIQQVLFYLNDYNYNNNNNYYYYLK